MSQVLKKIIIYGLYFSFLTPLIVVKSTIFPFVFPKAIFFYFIIEILFAIYLFAWYKYPRDFSPKKSILLFMVLIFLGISFISGIFGVNFTNSFFSTYERMDGVFNLMHFAIFFVILEAVLREREDWVNLLRVSFFVSFIISFYVFGVYVLKLSFLSYGNASATLGNPLYLCAYLIPHIFLGFYFIYDNLKNKVLNKLLRSEAKLEFIRGSNLKNNFTPHTASVAKQLQKLSRLNLDNLKRMVKSFWLWFYVFTTGFNIWALIFTGERGPQLALYSGIIIAIILYFVFLIKNKKISLKKAGIYVLSIFFIFFIIGFFSFNTSPINRLKTVFDFESASVKSRLLTWGVALEGIKDKPILGWGTGNFIIAEGYHYNPTRLASVNINFDKIHNKVLEVGIDSGFLGVISYLSIFGIVIYFLFKKQVIYFFNKKQVIYFLFKKQKENELNASILIALLIAYFIQNLTAFDSPASYLALFLALAFVSFILEQDKKHYNISLKSSVLFITYIIILLCFWQGIYQPWYANKNLAKAISLSAQDKTQVNKIYSFYNKSFSYNAMNYEGRIQLAKFITDNYNELGYKKLVYLIYLAEKELEKENTDHPNNILIKRFLAQIYDFQAMNKDPKYILEEERELKEAISISIDNPFLYYSLGRNYYKQFKEKKAKEAFQKYLELHPNPSQEQVDFINKAFPVISK